MESPTLIGEVVFGTDTDDKTKKELSESDLSFASAVGIAGSGGVGDGASASAGGRGFGGGGGGGGSGAGQPSFARNPGNRNPNLPPSVIPEPATLGLLPAAVLLLRRRRA